MNHSKQSKIKSWFHEVYSNDNIKKPIPKKTVIILLSFIITLFFFNFLLRLNAQKYPEKDDYFYATNTFKLKKRPLNKKYIEQIVKKSHLHYALVAPFAERKLNFFNKVKYINLVFGIMMILTVFFCGKILFSDFAGLVGAFFISLNSIVLERTMMLAPENLLILFSILALLFLVKGFDNPIYWLGGLVFSALAYLSKGNGIFVFASFVLSLPLILISGWGRLNYRNKVTYSITVLLFVLVGALFFDRILDLIGHFSVNKLLIKNPGHDLSEFIGLQKYQRYPDFLTHISEDLTGLLKKIIYGIQRELHIYSVGLFVSVEFAAPGKYSFSTGYILMPFLIFLLSKERSPERRIFYIMFAVVVFLGCVPRSAVGHGTARYSIMVTPLFFYIIAPLIFHLGMKIKERSALWMKRALAGLFIIALLANIVIFRKAFNNFSLAPELIPEFRWALHWLEKNTLKGERIGRDSNSKLSYKWYLPHIREVVSAGSKKGKELKGNKIVAFFRKKKVKFIIVDGVTSYSPYNRSKSKYFFKRHIKRKGKGLDLDIKALSRIGLELAARSPHEGGGLVILKLKEK